MIPAGKRTACSKTDITCEWNAFMPIVQSNNADGSIIVKNLLQRLKEMDDPSFEELSREIEWMLVQQSVDLPSSLCIVALKGNREVMEQLLRDGRDPNEADFNGRTPLHIASAMGFKDCVELLLDHEADVNSKDINGNVPLWEAIAGRNTLISKMLRDKGANLNCGRVCDFLCEAVQRSDLELLRDLIKFGADVNAVGKDGITALHVAVSKGFIEGIQILVANGADMDKVDRNSCTPRNLAECNGGKFLANLLESRDSVIEDHRIIIEEPSKMTTPKYREKNKPTLPSPDNWNHNSVVKSMRKRADVIDFHDSILGMLPNSKTNHIQSVSFHSVNLDSPRTKKRNISKKNSIRRVTIRRCHPKWKGLSSSQHGKLINLPSSLPNLLQTAGKKFGYDPIMVLSEDGAEIDDLDVVRDGDNLFVVDNTELERDNMS
eukprot:Gb_29963 [translate_table: standard]